MPDGYDTVVGERGREVAHVNPETLHPSPADFGEAGRLWHSGRRAGARSRACDP